MFRGFDVVGCVRNRAWRFSLVLSGDALYLHGVWPGIACGWMAYAALKIQELTKLEWKS